MKKKIFKQGGESLFSKVIFNQAFRWETDFDLEKEGKNITKRGKRNLQLPFELVYSTPNQISNMTYQIALMMYLHYYNLNTSKIVEYTKREISVISGACDKTVLKAMRELESVGLIIVHPTSAGKPIHYSLTSVKTGQFFDYDSLELRLVKLTNDELRLYMALSSNTEELSINEIIDKLQMQTVLAEKALKNLIGMRYLVKVNDKYHAIR